MHTSAVLDAAVCDDHNIDLVLGQVPEWSDMVNIITTHHHDYKECICVQMDSICTSLLVCIFVNMSKTKLVRNQTVVTFHGQKPIMSFFFSIIFPAKLPICMGKLLVEGTDIGTKD